MMKELLLGCVALGVVGGGIYMKGGAVGTNVYAVSAKDAQSRLQSTPMRVGKWSPFDDGPVEVLAAPGKVVWKSIEGRAVTCTADIEATGENQSRIVSTCKMGGTKIGDIPDVDNALKSALLTEHVDATMLRRAFSEKNAQSAAAATVMANTDKVFSGVSKGMKDFDEKQKEARSSNWGSSAVKDPIVATTNVAEAATSDDSDWSENTEE